MALRAVFTEFTDVHQLELGGGQIGERCDRKAVPIRIAHLKRLEKGTIIIGQRSAQRADQMIERCLRIIIAEGLERHPLELRLKGLTLILVRGIEEFRDLAAVADEAGDRA